MMNLLRKYARNTEGSVIVELLIPFSLLVWVYGMAIVYFDAFKHHNLNLKAAYTIGDMLSRQGQAIDTAYLDGMGDVFDYLTLQRYPSQIRVSSIYWQSAYDRYRLDWSYSTGDKAPLGNADLSMSAEENIAPRLPNLVNGERIILVETWTDYQPYFPAGINSFYNFSNFVVTSPRYSPKLVLN